MPKIVQIQGDQNTLYDLDNRYIELSATSGTLTEEQLATLQASSKNYIIHNNFIYSKTGENNDYLWYGFEDIGLEHFYFYTINKGTGAFGFTTKTYTEKASPATAGNLAELTSGGNIADSGIAASDIQKSITKEVENDPDNSSFDITISDGQDAPILSTVIKGKTAAQNQLVVDGGFTDSSNWAATNATLSLSNNVARSTCTTAGLINIKPAAVVKYIAGHVYYQRVYARTSTSAYAARLSTALSVIEPTTTSNSFVELEVIGSRSSDTTAAYPQVIMQNASVGDYIEAKWMVNFDLTARGFTAAEYASASALKTAWLKKYGTPIPLFSPYDGGSLANVNGEYHVRGRNLWDEEWEAGHINGSGQEEAASTIRSKNYMPCEQGQTYYGHIGATATLFIVWYDAEKNFISRVGATNTTATAPSGARYFRITTIAAYGSTYNHDICINLSDPSINGQYFPYYDGGTIDCSGKPLNGVGTAQDEEDYATGVRTTRCGMVDLGTLNWSYTTISGNSAFYAAISDAIGGTNKTNLICARYTAAASVADKNMWLNNKSVYIIDNDFSDAAAFTTSVSGLYLGYELATPVTTTETPQPLETQYGYNVLEPVSGGVQSAEVKIRYISDKGTSEIIDYVDNAISTSILDAINTTY